MSPDPRVCNLLDLNGSNFNREANSNVSEVIQAIAQQVMEEFAQNFLPRNHNNIVEGCTVKQLNRMHTSSFDRKGGSTMAED